MSAHFQLEAPAGRQLKGRQSAVAFNIEIAGAVLIPPSCVALRDIIMADIKRALNANDILCVGQPDQSNDFEPRSGAYSVCGANGCYGLFIVSDFQKALLTLQGEFARTSLIGHAEIGWLCPDEWVWRRYWPKADARPFTAKILSGPAQRLVNTKLLQALAWFGSFCPPPPPA